jgi:hypothetical protein
VSFDPDLKYLAGVYLNEPMSPDPQSSYFKALDRLVKACKLAGVDHHQVVSEVLNEMKEHL